MADPVILEAIKGFKMIERTYEHDDGNANRRVVEPYAHDRATNIFLSIYTRSENGAAACVATVGVDSAYP